MNFFSMLDYLGSKPVAGIVTWLSGWLLSFVSVKIDIYNNCQPAEVLWYFQITSLIIGSTAGILTIISIIRKFYKKTNHDKR